MRVIARAIWMTAETLPPIEPETAGVLLRQAREAAGLSLDDVAQQLKLAPRQVAALEGGDWSRLPGRTFVRGFMRNYARLLHLDPDAVLSALPGTAAAPSLASPTLHATASSFGELPASGRGRFPWTIWAIPLALIAIVGGAVVYEYVPRGAGGPRSDAAQPTAPASTRGETTTMLPNPLATAPAPEPAVSASAPTVATSTPGPDAAPATPAAAAPPAEEATMVLDYRDYSWTEVRDRSGRVLLAKMMKGGEKQSVSGVPPFDVVVGNASDVKITYREQPVDLAPLSRGNVARFTLK